ncbi:MAG: hypothetical protein LBF41_05755, partial [Deltaproteobacteria bacterium]|nr:hypothetical protein [Deltaproteobacteria bacterium]
MTKVKKNFYQKKRKRNDAATVFFEVKISFKRSKTPAFGNPGDLPDNDRERSFKRQSRSQCLGNRGAGGISKKQTTKT